MAAHFPVALWLTAFLAILFRSLSDGATARTVDTALPLLLAFGALTGAVAYLLGLLVWPWDTLTNSPAGRNHMLMASWTLAYWILLWVTRLRLGPGVWVGSQRWVMLGLAALGAGLLAVTGTLGGKLAGNPSAVTGIVQRLGWDVNTTFFLPDAVLAVVLLAALLLGLLGAAGLRRRG